MSKNEQGGVRKTDKFAMIPADVLLRSDLSMTAKVVLGVLAMEAFPSTKISISHSAIAKLCKAGRTAVVEATVQLAKLGLIAQSAGCRGSALDYNVLHERFHRFAKRSAASGTECATCHRLRKVNQAGMCGACVAQARAAAKVDAVLRDRPNATRQEVYLEIRSAGARTIGRAFDAAKRKGVA